ELHAAEDVRLHRVANHNGLVGGESELFACGTEHDRARLADAERLHAGCPFEHGDDRAAAGSCAGLSGAVRIEVGGHELGAAQDHAQGGFDHLEVERPPLADHDV